MKPYKTIKRLTFAAVTAMAAGLASCDYLDVVPPEQVGVDDGMENLTTAQGFLYSCYSFMTHAYSGELPYNWPLSDINYTNDEIINPYGWNSDAGANGFEGLILLNTLSPSNNNNVWHHLYSGIGQCHLFMNEMDKTNIVGRGVITEEMAREWRAEAVALSAYYHWRLLHRYGPIVLLDERPSLETPSSKFNGRSHFDYCVKWICDKLDKAAADLPAHRPATEHGRMTSTICKAIKSQILLYAASPLWNGKFPFANFKNNNLETPGYGQELVSRTYDVAKWQKAYDAADEAIRFAETEGERAIYTDNFYEQSGVQLSELFVPGNVDDNFKKAVLRMRYLHYACEGEGNREPIWDIYGNYEVLSMHTYSWPANYSTSGNVLRSGYCGNAPTLNAVENFLTENGLLPANDPDFAPESEWFERAGIPNDSEGRYRDRIIKLNVHREPRFYAWLGFDGGDYTLRLCNGKPVHLNLLQKHNPNNPGDIEGYHGYMLSKGNRDNNPTGYFNQKFLFPTLTVPHSSFYFTGYANSSVKVIRLAEMYLNRAEAAAQLGKTQQAIDDVNVIRARAGAKLLTQDMIGKGGMTLLDWVLQERRIEFFNEGVRYFDIRRYVQGEKYLGYGKRRGLNAMEKENPTFEEFNKPISLPYPYTWGNKLYLYPIPQDEVYSNPQCVQNPGY